MSREASAAVIGGMRFCAWTRPSGTVRFARKHAVDARTGEHRCGLLLNDGLDSPLPDRAYERSIIAAVLGAVLDRELGDSIVERLAGAHVTGDHRSVPGAGMRPGQGMCA